MIERSYGILQALRGDLSRLVTTVMYYRIPVRAPVPCSLFKTHI